MKTEHKSERIKGFHETKRTQKTTDLFTEFQWPFLHLFEGAQARLNFNSAP